MVFFCKFTWWKIFRKFFRNFGFFFDNESIKNKLKNFYYQSFVSDREHSKIIMIRLRQISGLEEEHRKKIKKFIIREIWFIIKKYWDFRKEYFFIIDLYKWIVDIANDENFLFEIIDDLNVESSVFYLFSGFIEEVLLVSQVEDLLQRFLKTHFHILVKIFSHFEKNNSTDLIKKFLENPEFQEWMEQRQRQIQENNELFVQETKKRYEKQRNKFIKVLESIDEKWFHPWIFQGFIKMQKGIEDIFPENIEREKVIQKVKLQFLNALPTIKITQYDSDVFARVFYEKREDASYRYAREIDILKYIFCLAKIFQYDILEYYKIFVLHFCIFHLHR